MTRTAEHLYNYQGIGAKRIGGQRGSVTSGVNRQGGDPDRHNKLLKV